MKPASQLCLLLALLFGSGAIKAQSDWPDADSIVGISVLVFEHANTSKLSVAQEGITPFPSAIGLPKISELHSRYSMQTRRDSSARSREANSANAPTLPWSMRNWLHFMHAGLLSQLEQPLTGPPLPPKPSAPLLNSPLLMRESAELPENLRPAVDRVDVSTAYTLLRAMHWYQTLDRQTTGPKIDVTDQSIQSSMPWLDSIAWVDRSSDQPIYTDQLAGYLQLTQDQFTRAEVNVCLHETHQKNYGPLQRSHLAPTGYQVTCLQVNRAIEPNQWNYFDSETLGVLLHVSTR